MPPVAEAHHLSVFRGRTPVALVEDVSFAVDPGEILGVVGETGAGKTLATRALLGVLAPTLRASGTLRVGETSVAYDPDRPLSLAARPPALARDAGVVLQNPALMLDPLQRIDAQLVEAVVAHGLLERPAALERAAELLGTLGFAAPEQVMRLYPHELSGGMAQRTALALALMPRPRLLVVDEPTSALDANVRIAVLDALAALARTDEMAIVLVSHDLPLVARYTDRLLVMYAGRIVEHGATAGVLRRPRHPYTRALLQTGASLRSARRQPLPTISGTTPPADDRPTGCVFRPRCPSAFARCEAERPALPGDEAGAACFLDSSVRERVAS